MIKRLLDRWRARKHLAAFRRGEKTISVLATAGAPLPPWIPGQLPALTIRKVSQHDVAVLAWRDRTSAEQWNRENKYPAGPAQALELNYADFEHFLSNLSSAQRSRIQLEMF